jgi:hypothetical protein
MRTGTIKRPAELFTEQTQQLTSETHRYPQIHANRANAQNSKLSASRNHLTLGLYTRADYALIDPLLDEDEATQKKIRSIERARASAHSHLHRSINQLRKLQSPPQPPEITSRTTLYPASYQHPAPCRARSAPFHQPPCAQEQS